MAEITTASSEQKPGVRRSKKLSTRVDLTPMVDLGFLLITFFIFTTTMSEPMVTNLKMPTDEKTNNPSKAPRTVTLTLIAVDPNTIFYYHGILEEALKDGSYGTTNYNVRTGAGALIREKQAYLDRIGKGRTEMILIIKPSENSVYRNTVDMLDEVMINDVKTYVLMDIDEEERRVLTGKKLLVSSH